MRILKRRGILPSNTMEVVDSSFRDMMTGGGRKKTLKVLAILVAMHCFYTSSYMSENKQLFRRTSETPASAFDSTASTMPLELLQAIQQSSLKGESSVPATDLTSGDQVVSKEDKEDEEEIEDEEEGRSLVSKIFGGKSKSNNKDDEKERTLSDKNDVDSKNEADNDANEVEGAEEELEMKELDVEGKEKGAETSEKSLLLHNLDPSSLLEMDSETLNKVLEVNNINPNVLPSFDGDAPVDNKRLPVDEKVPTNKKSAAKDRSHMVMPTPEAIMTKMAIDGKDEEEELPPDVGFIGMGSKNERGNDDIGTSILDPPSAEENLLGNPRPVAPRGPRGQQEQEPLFSPPQGQVELPQNQDLAALLQQFGGSQDELLAALAQIQGGGDEGESNLQVAPASGAPLKKKGKKGKKDSKIPAWCARAPRIPSPKTQPLRPTMIASYPGSGARLSWKLIRAVTGFMTSDDAVDTNDLAKQALVIAIKTHYPAHGSNEALFKPFANVDRSVLLIRNPMKSMPSFLSYLYEQENGLENHSTRVPVEEWIQWRDHHFQEEIMSWVQHTLFWMEHNEPNDTLIMSYEDLINEDTGPTELGRLGSFLQATSGEELAQSAKNIPCVWDYIINSRGDTSTNGKTPQSHRKGPKSYPFTDEQVDTMIHYFTSLSSMYPDELGQILDGYIVDTLALKAKVRD